MANEKQKKINTLLEIEKFQKSVQEEIDLMRSLKLRAESEIKCPYTLEARIADYDYCIVALVKKYFKYGFQNDFA